MTLNKQLLCVSLLLLSLPWAGCQYLQEMDSILRNSQERALSASTEAIAAVFAQRSDLLYPHGEIYNAPIADASKNTPTPLYFHPITAAIWVDGYGEEWETIPSFTFKSSYSTQRQVRYRTAQYKKQLYLFFEVSDDDIVYNNPSRSKINDGDRIVISTGTGKHYVFTTSAPGNITARYINGKLGTYRESSITAQWQDTDAGYTIEISIPAALAAGRVGFSIVDQNRQLLNDKQLHQYGPFPASNVSTLTTSNQPTSLPPWYIYQPETLQQQLAIFDQEGQRLKIFDPYAWTLATQGSFTSTNNTHNTESHWLIRTLYRKLLDANPNNVVAYQHKANSQHRPEIKQALKGKAATTWYKDSERNNQYIVASAAPIVVSNSESNRVIGTIVAEQNSEQMAALSDNAFKRLLVQGLGAISIVTIGLLGYASWLSWRIRRLSDAANQVISDDGKWLGQFPNSRAQDEVGELTRNYAQLLDRIKDYTEYLQTLSRKLSHELRTPLAIIHSSLDNLSNQSLDDKCETYQQRAKDGALRLGNILTAMSEASRVEESIEHAEPEQFDVLALVSNVMHAYQDVYPNKMIRFKEYSESKTHPQKSNTLITAVPDLLVQMLDKLMDNAASFCPDGGTIECTLEAKADTICINISNDGALLPEKMRGQLFDNMVSMRSDDQHSSHLGLGLHIVNLIVKYHGGRVTATNREDESGVCFRVVLPIYN